MSLRQGDVFRGFGFPALRPSEELRVDSTFGLSERPDAASPRMVRGQPRKGESKANLFLATLELDFRFQFYIVLSQCCTLEIRQPGRFPNWVVVSPLRPAQEITNQETLELIKLNHPNEKIGNFFLPKCPETSEDLVVEFGQLVSVSGLYYQHILHQRVRQLDDLQRGALKNKLAFYFARETDEEESADVLNRSYEAAEERLKRYKESRDLAESHSPATQKSEQPPTFPNSD